MNIRALIGLALLVACSCSVRAQETKWEGWHRIVSSTGGNSTFNARKAQTYCTLEFREGKVSGSTTTFGWNAPKDPSNEFRAKHTEKIQGTIDGEILEWKGTRSGDDYGGEKKKFFVETTFHGVKDGDVIVGYYEQQWTIGGRKKDTYRGVAEFKLEKPQ